MDWPDRSKNLNPIQHAWKLWEGKLLLVTPSEDHPGPENSNAERVESIATGTHKILLFPELITEKGFNICKREPINLCFLILHTQPPFNIFQL
ncbi:hypothetical protein TNCV_564171 [Trichonephila clavipes]|nr:hypothetical protein TNCV_564171 [Trichonephila clavipes]